MNLISLCKYMTLWPNSTSKHSSLRDDSLSPYKYTTSLFPNQYGTPAHSNTNLHIQAQLECGPRVQIEMVVKSSSEMAL